MSQFKATWNQHFTTAAAPTQNDVEQDLWNDEANVVHSLAASQQYQTALLDQADDSGGIATTYARGR